MAAAQFHDRYRVAAFLAMVGVHATITYMHSQPLTPAARARLWSAIAATAIVLGLNVLLANLS